ncbi:MAG: helix-hairpin-helix domain-containing protein [Thermoleophilia bacterium]|nr:helix-hairpin-helix domain-containing protein [Thermoleophilia bacterium]MDQ3858815.1 helix-hairpin-helix domain-containing protein [Actinomycetota bacterium]
MPEISRRRALAYAAVLIALLALAARFVGSPDDARPAPPKTAELKAEPQKPRQVIVHVVGAVVEPGLYRLADGSRVDDAIRRAGGAKPKAALELVNLAAPVADGQQVVVPARGAAGGGAAGSSASAPSTRRVHLNSATVEELDALPGVGPVTAQKIVDYRTAKGAFSSVDELDAVPGIGPARLAELRELVDL